MTAMHCAQRQVVKLVGESRPALENREVFEQRDDADHDDDDLQDLLDAALDRQALNQPEDEHDDEEGNQN